MGQQTRENLQKNIEKQMEAQREKNKELEKKLNQEGELRKDTNIKGTELSREDLLRQYKELKAKNDHLKNEMSQYKRCDPERFEAQKEDIKKSFAACNRWVDNGYELSSWVRKKNAGVSQEQLER